MSHIDRMKVELEELSKKVVALDNFAHSDNEVFCSLPPIEQEDMWVQLEAMEAYQAVLSKRLERALSTLKG